MKTITVDGNEACSNTSYMFTEVAGIYPITPSSPMAEHLDEWSNKNRLNLFNSPVKVVEMQSEAGAAGMVHGSLQMGCLTSTYTASQGLLLMIPNMYKMAGEMLPCVMHVAARSLSTHALSIFGDHQDIYATRATGFCMLSSSSVFDAAYLSGIAHLSALKSSLPFMHFFDGFRTSHELQKINVLEENEWETLIDKEAINKFREKAINIDNPKTIGTAQNGDVYFQATEVRNKFYDIVPDIVNDYMEKVNKLANTDYKPFNYYGDDNAENIIVAMGSVCETIKETIDVLNKENYKVGLIEVHLYRPFSNTYLKKVLPESVKRIAVLDRTKEAGSNGEPLYLDICAALKDTNILVVGGRYGLSSKNTTPNQIKAVYDSLKINPKNNFTIGIKDDVTNLSLEVDNNFKINNATEILIYGYGSDGMVSASKSLIKLIGNNTDKYVQGYFEYDSKKSGGVTRSHIRFSTDKIRSTYYVENPEVIVISKDSYLNDFECLNDIKENGILILNTSKTKEEVNNLLTGKDKNILVERNIKVYIINAYMLARKTGLKNKISTIMESAITSILKLIDYDTAKQEMKKHAYNRFFKKGEDILNANYEAIDEASKYLSEVTINNEIIVLKPNNKNLSVYEAMERRKGDELPVSAFLDKPNGEFEAGTSKYQKRGISDIVPRWLSNNCIECNQCSFVCPHGVIRPFLLDSKEYEKAPDYVKSRAIKPIGKDMDDYYYIVGISVKDCTGCGVCMKTCPGKKQEKALISSELETEIRNKEQEIFDYLDEHITPKKVFNQNIVKGIEFNDSKFVYSGACGGCGQPAYIKLLTKLFGNDLVISNATGCSSIYGGSAPITPYTVPWSSSLFEDNAEYGYGMLVANNTIRNRIKTIMENNMDNSNSELFKKWLENYDSYEVTSYVYDNLTDDIPEELKEIKEYIKTKTIWTIGGDGWAYDIGFSGIDHVLASSDNVNILVLDTQVYSNTGGQSSKASPKGSIASFTSSGKNNIKKDLARIALAYPHVYVAQVSLGANQNHLIKIMKEAASYNGPSIVIAYTPCISHGIKGGLENSIEMEKMATKCGYFPIFHYNPIDEKFTLDYKDTDFDLYEEFLNSQTRYNMLKVINPSKSEELLKANKEAAIKRYQYYLKLDDLSNQM